MKHLQLKYNFLQIAFWAASCSLIGYLAVFLKHKGFTNSLIGIVSGCACLLNIFLSPYLSGLYDRHEKLSIKKLLTFTLLFGVLLFLVIALIPLPAQVIMVAYVLVYSLNVSSVPFLSTIAMDYIKAGQDVNFGLARGLGSVSYATSALFLGSLVKWINPDALSFFYLATVALFLLTLYSCQDVHLEKAAEKVQGASVQVIIKRYPVFFFLLLGFTFSFAASTTLSTYLINIVTRLGGDTSLYGIAVFCMAASEMPVMALAPRLMKHFHSTLLIMVASFFYIVRNFLICLAPNLVILMIGMACQSMSYALMTAVITYYVTYNLADADQVMGQTMIAIMTTGVGSMIGNVFGGFLSDAFGITMMLIFACALTLLGFIIVWVTGLKQGKNIFKNDLFTRDR